LFELRPDGERVDDPERYRVQAEAEQAATAMLIRQPDLQFVEIAEHDAAGDDDGTVGRIGTAQPPVPEAAEVDDLHKLPRGDPEC
jgi:hypothetical protein